MSDCDWMFEIAYDPLNETFSGLTRESLGPAHEPEAAPLSRVPRAGGGPGAKHTDLAPGSRATCSAGARGPWIPTYAGNAG